MVQRASLKKIKTFLLDLFSAVSRLVLGRVGEEQSLRDIGQLISGKYVLLVGEYTGKGRAAFLGRVVWWIFSSESDGLYVCGLKKI